MIQASEPGQLIILTPEDYIALSPQDFGMPEGVSATEIIGPFAPIKGVGPLIMAHDGVLEPPWDWVIILTATTSACSIS
jgi:hypothetical protein